MSLYQLNNTSSEHMVSPNQDIPRDEMDVFFRSEENFLPEGKTFDTLTEKEKEDLKKRYRFDVLRPGCYQGITALEKMIKM